MHFWKLLATIAIRYQILKNQAEKETETGHAHQQVAPPIMRTGTNHSFYSKSSLAKIWFRNRHDILRPALNNLRATLNISELQMMDQVVSHNMTEAHLQSTNNSQLLSYINGLHNVSLDGLYNVSLNGLYNVSLQNDSSLVRLHNTSEENEAFDSVNDTGRPNINLNDVLPWDISYFRINDTWYHDGAHDSDSLPRLTWLALTAGMFTTVAYPSCARWNCPCSGYPKRGERSARSVDLQLLRRTTTTAQQHTLQLLKTLENSRFRGNKEHIYSLKRCSEQRGEQCMITYVEDNCSLEGLPSMAHIYQHSTTPEFDNFMQEARMILATIAMFMDKARREEQHHYTGNTKSMAHDLEMLEELGIYHLLCAMDKGLRGAEFTELPAELQCDAKLTRAKADNRNYIVLHTFDNYLRSLLAKLSHRLGDELEN